jgi:hypothetical protein
MLERLKDALADQTAASDRKRDEAKSAGGLPRFQPQPGGFGRRATPVGAAPVAPAATADGEATPQPQFRETRDGGTSGSPGSEAAGAWSPGAPARHPASLRSAVMGDVPTRVADWLMRELKDERGIHCETLLTVIGALAGYAAQQALWEGMVKPGKLAISEAFEVVETRSGATYFFGDTLDTMLASMEPKHVSVWKIVSGGALYGGGDHLPDIGELLRHAAATVGTAAFGLPRLPDEHLPSILPRAALERFWPGARLLLTLADPLQWPLHMAHAAQKLMLAMRESIAPDLAVRIVMEAAVPMSRVDPTTVPNN